MVTSSPDLRRHRGRPLRRGRLGASRSGLEVGVGSPPTTTGVGSIDRGRKGCTRLDRGSAGPIGGLSKGLVAAHRRGGGLHLPTGKQRAGDRRSGFVVAARV